jgi:rRNA maturation RNase YbeY
VICRDEFLLEYNRRFLKRDYLTDVISFDLSDEEQIIYGEVYISIDRIKENAAKYRISVEEELARVIFHGALHLTGFNDNTERERQEMQKQEEIYLKSSEIQ